MQDDCPAPIDRHAAPEGPSRRRPSLAMVALLVLAAPLLLDGAKVCYARWAALTGPMPAIQTPALDLAADSLDRFGSAARRRADRPFGRVPVPIEQAVGTLVLSLAAGAIVMRHGRPR